jgi:hypothetical protein
MYEYDSVKVFWSSHDLSLRAVPTNDLLNGSDIRAVNVWYMSDDIMCNKCIFFFFFRFVSSHAIGSQHCASGTSS